MRQHKERAIGQQHKMTLPPPKNPRPKKCRGCGEKFRPSPALRRASVCSPECGLVVGRELNRKSAEAANRKRRREFRDKDRPFHVKEAQIAFNKFIRTRDFDKPCISCGRFHNGQWHAGHYRTTAAQPALRFNELNCHKQCAPCNNHKSGNITEYRIDLVKRIGVGLVEWLEIDHKQPSKWTIPELKAIRKYYQNAAKEILVIAEVEQPF